MNYITLFSKHTHSLCKSGFLHTSVKLLHPSLACIQYSLEQLFSWHSCANSKNNASCQHLRIWTLVADFIKAHLKRKANLKYQTVTMNLKFNSAGSKSCIFDTLGGCTCLSYMRGSKYSNWIMQICKTVLELKVTTEAGEVFPPLDNNSI